MVYDYRVLLEQLSTSVSDDGSGLGWGERGFKDLVWGVCVKSICEREPFVFH